MAIFIDGSAHPNPGPGGFALVELDDNNKVIFCHQEQFNHTTNNEMELKACLYALVKYGNPQSLFIPTIYCDSAYAINTLTSWKNNWKRNNWIKSDKKIPENLTIIQNYDIIEEKGYKIDLRKIQGHKGILGNELADALATGRMTEQEVMQKYG